MKQAGIPTYDSPDRAVRAFMYLVAFQRNREILYETPRQLPLDAVANEGRLLVEQLLAAGRETLTEIESKELLAAYGIATTVPRPASTSTEAVAIACELGYPLVMKVHSPQILHKTEVRGVVTGISDDDDVRRTFTEIVERAKRMRPDAEIKGVTLQPMLTAAESLELIVGAKKDPVFGAVMMVGAGGITAEVLADRALELPPLNERLSRRMLESLRIRPLLGNFRGRRAIHFDRLVETLMRFSYLIAENPCIAELDVNPLLVTPDGATALDARVILDLSAEEVNPRPYSHLAIRPYPQEYVRQVTLADGSKLLLRPIRPEDESMWHEYLRKCSQHSIWMRFRYLFKESTHEMATRFCFVDYDRTMAIVAEIETDNKRELVGVVRLVADADHRDAEFAILVTDDWQGRGLGTLMTDYCMELCDSWGISRVFAETTEDNQHMQEILRRHNFRRKKSTNGEVLYETILSERSSEPLSNIAEIIA